MTGNRHRYVRGVAFAAAVALLAVGCNRPGRTPRPSTTTAPRVTTPPTTGGHDHHTPERLDHPPTEEQKAAALKFVDDTRAAVKAQNLTLAKIQEQHYIGIGDGVHYVKPEFIRDGKNLDPNAIEAFTVRGGRIVAAMYIFVKEGGATMDDVPDIAGNWTIWHDHVLPYRSDDPNSDDYYRLGGPYRRQDSPMIHVWLEPNRCGPFAGAGVGEGSCLTELADY